MKAKSDIIRNFNKLSRIDGVSIDITDAEQTVRISHKLKHSPNYVFKWIDGSHFVGYFIDRKGKKSQAIYSIWSASEASVFRIVYNHQIKLRAKRY